MNYRKIILFLALIAIMWRILTWMSFNQIGFIGIVENDAGTITKISLNSPAEKYGLMVGDEILLVIGLEPDKRPKPHQLINYSIIRNGKAMEISLKTSSKDYSETKILGIMGILILLLGVVVFLRKQNILSLVFFLYCFVMVIHWGGYPQVVSADFQNIIKASVKLIIN